jgi:hypothetical protein
MSDPFSEIKVTLESLEREQRERFQPKPEQKPQAPQTREEQARANLDRLNASCSPSISVDAGWLG